MRNKYKPYIRKANGKEMSERLNVAYRLAFYRRLGKPFYVMDSEVSQTSLSMPDPTEEKYLAYPLGLCRAGSTRGLTV